MKLRLRSLETRETIKIEVPADCSLRDLREALSKRVISSPSRASGLHLSLNLKEELVGSSPQVCLQSLGVTSDDLVYFTVNPSEFSSETLIGKSNVNSMEPQNSKENLATEPISQGEEGKVSEIVDREMMSAADKQSPSMDALKEQNLDVEFVNSETLAVDARKVGSPNSEPGRSETSAERDQRIGLDVQEKGNLGMAEPDKMDVDGSVLEVEKSFSAPIFLSKMFRQDIGDNGGDHRLVVIAVHAVMLESRFVAFDSVSNTKFEGFHLPDEWPSSAFTVSLWYTLPEIVGHGPSVVNGVETVLLKFQSLGKFINIYGSLANNGSGPYWVRLDKDRLSFFLNLLWANCDLVNEMVGEDRVANIYPEKEVFEFCKTVKDKLALPLLIDLCERAGLAPPPCFMRLPTDLKLRILESLPGDDIAKMGCVCSELRYLSSNDDLWKQKYVEQFGNAAGSLGGNQWKEKFAKTWEGRKRRKRTISQRLLRLRGVPFPPWAPRVREPYGPRFPVIISGEHDLIPAGFRLGRQVGALPRRKSVLRCNLGERSL